MNSVKQIEACRKKVPAAVEAHKKSDNRNDQTPCPGCDGEGKMPLIVSLDPPRSMDVDCPLCQKIGD